MPDLIPCAEFPKNHLEQATDWILVLEAEPQKLEAFNAWLIAAPEHLEAWVQVNQVWGALAQQPATTESQWPNVTLISSPPAKPSRWRYYAAAASLTALTIATLLTMPRDWRADYSSGIAQTLEVQLEDGSHLTLGPQSAINVRFEQNIRQVTLLSGEVFFQVAHDTNKPFQINAEDVAVRVLGTSFEVCVDETQVSVQVREGAVSVNKGEQPFRLGAGQALNLDRSSGTANSFSVSPDEVASWTTGKKFFENTTVSQVVKQLQRYHRGWIIIEDPLLANRRVTGLYDLRDPQRALQALAAPLDAQLAQYSSWLLVLRKK